MKRYLYGALAAIIAVGAAAFTTPNQSAALEGDTFFYTSTNYSQLEVQKNSNWQYGSSDCEGDPNKACQMQVSTTLTHPVTGGRALNTSGSVLAITATAGADASGFVPDPASTSGISGVVNKP